ncbi:MAG: alanine dehydrogenase [Actinobacteria bacterium HGW-Actinobacteria-4]|nr:MAG: alanine dehydrogenase [Actinobacteria bacterium HGW-Actinobacteria-4]
MRIGVPTEIKNRETRVALTPAGAASLVAAGHSVVVQEGAGLGSMMQDAAYADAGAAIVTAQQAWASDLVLKVKEPVPSEYPLLAGQTLFTFLHLSADRALAEALVSAGTTGFSYDTVQLADGSLPLLTPMSVVAGRLAALAGAYHLLSSQGGRGVLLSGVPGAGDVAAVDGARVTVIGAGVAGTQALDQAVAMGARVAVLDLAEDRLRSVDKAYRHTGRVRTEVSTHEAVEREVIESDLVIGAVLVPGRRAPVVVTSEMVARMPHGSVLVDIAIDQGGCFEDSRPTTHDDPVFRVANSLMYCVANMPGAVGVTSTHALTNATLPYVEALAGGWEGAVAADAALALGLNVAGGQVRHPAIAEAFPDLPRAG